MTRLLILGGTGEAAELARAVTAAFDGGIKLVVSLAGRTRAPAPLPGRVRSGGFGGADGLARYLRDEGIDLLVDATHPFAARISANARKACAAAAVPRLMLLRPPWRKQAGDNWIAVSDANEAARRLPEFGKRAFLALGSGDLSAFAGIAGVSILLRVAEQPPWPPLPVAEIVVGRGPFETQAEYRLLAERRIDVVVSRNSGGDGAAGKIIAARRLGLPVIMIERPAPEPGARAETIEETIAWIAGNPT